MVKPFLQRTYPTYLDLTDKLDDGPTVRIVTHALTDIDDQLSRWQEAAEDAGQSDPQRNSRLAARLAELEYCRR